MSYTVSHFEIRARDQEAMEKFYTEVLGFIVSDRGVLNAGPMKGRELIFLSHSPEEHHQIVLIPSDVTDQGGGIGHVAFRVDSLDEVRRVYEKMRDLPHAKPEPVSHANTWSSISATPKATASRSLRRRHGTRRSPAASTSITISPTPS